MEMNVLHGHWWKKKKVHGQPKSVNAAADVLINTRTEQGSL